MSPRLPLAGAAAVLLVAAGGFAFATRGPAAPRSPYGDAVGDRVHDFTFRDVSGERRRLSSWLASGPVVVAMRDGGCPVAQKYGAELGRIAREYEQRGVRFIYLNVNGAEGEDVGRREQEQFGLVGAYVLDERWSVAGKLRPATTTEVFVIDGAGTLRYRGAIDDQYGLTHTRAEPRERYLRSALDAVLDGRPVAVGTVPAEGCVVEPPGELRVSERAVTYHGRVSRIVQQNCQSCHRSGGIAPFALEEYAQVKAYAPMMKYMIDAGRMPPWFAEHGVGDWSNERRIPDRHRADLVAWMDAGMPEGRERDAPAPVRWVEGWNIGEPQAVLELPEPFEIPAEGVVEYQYMYVKTDFPEDRWVQAFEIRPTAMQHTHHVLVFIEEPGRSFEPRPGEPPFQGGLRGYFASMAPGSVGVVYPDGMAKRLPAGAWLKFQMHYTTNGTAATDRTRLGLVFAKEPPRIEVRTGSAFNTRFVIPAGTKRHEVPGEYRFGTDAQIVNFFPHMHNRGAAFRYELIRPDGAAQTLLEIPRYDFNWQLTYVPRRPILAPSGSVLRATGWFDNSADHPGNPDPTQDVQFGEQTWEEMMIGYFDWIAVSDTEN